jgi:outer membrane protein assembly factor BamB
MRRALLLAALALAVLGAVSTGPASVAATTRGLVPANEWPQFGHDAGHSFANLGEGTLTRNRVANGLRVTSVDVGLGQVVQPVVRGSSLYAASWTWDFMGGRIVRIDVPTHDHVWRQGLTCFTPPIASGTTLLINDTCSQSEPWTPWALRTSNGERRYHAVGYLGVVDHHTAFLSNNSGQDLIDKNEVTATDVTTGDVVWTKQTPDGEPWGDPVLASQGVLYVTRGDAIEAWDETTGDLLWSRTPARTTVPLAAAWDSLIVRWTDGDRSGIARWDPTDGHTVWQLRGDADDRIALTPGEIYRTGPDFLESRRVRDGALVWHRTGPAWSGQGQPSFAGGVIWTMANDDLVAFDATDGDQLQAIRLAPAAPIAIALGRVFVPTPDGRVFIVRAAS